MFLFVLVLSPQPRPALAADGVVLVNGAGHRLSRITDDEIALHLLVERGAEVRAIEREDPRLR